jgi:ferredoxin|tara:strand:+ start:7606 stop:9249 length:1644 start_codon:yes stop_codon:yes gene_type:complete
MNQRGDFRQRMNSLLRLTNVRILSQCFFVSLFIAAIWLTWTSRIEGYRVSWFLEIDPLVTLSTVLSTGYVYRYLGWALLIVMLTLLFGRVFCGWMCPFGALLQFTGWLFHRGADKKTDDNRYHSLQSTKYILLVVFLVLALLGALQIGLMDPLVWVYRGFTTFVAPLWDLVMDQLMSFGDAVAVPVDLSGAKFSPGAPVRVFTGSFWIGALFVVFLALNVRWHRFFCRFLCPLGALLGVISRFSVFRIDRDVNLCTDCNLCLLACEGASEPHSKLMASECFSCMNCIDDCPENALRFAAHDLDRQQVIAAPDVTRRQWLFASVLGLVSYPLLKSNGFASDENFSADMMRPPGSVAEEEFLAKCIKCDQCINVCPTNVLQPATLREGGIEALWTPVLNFNIRQCQLKCTLCSEVCPTGAIRKITVAEKLGMGEFNEQGPIRMGTAFINRSRCLPWANQIPCVVCEEVCPTAPKAIQTYDEEEKDVFGKLVVLNKPHIVPDLCIGCGICQAECPVQDRPAVYVTAVGESRSDNRRLLLKYRSAKESEPG